MCAYIDLVTILTMGPTAKLKEDNVPATDAKRFAVTEFFRKINAILLFNFVTLAGGQ